MRSVNISLAILVVLSGCCWIRVGPVAPPPPRANFQNPPQMQPRVEPPPNAIVEAPKPPAPVGPAGKKMIDLIPLIDPAKDKVHGNRWEILDNELHCKGDTFVPRMEIPYLPPEEYDFIVVFSQPKLRNGISLIMPKPNGAGSFFWYLGSGSGTACGFAAAPKNKEMLMPGLIQANTAHTTRVEVRRTSVTGFVDGKECIRHQTDFGDLTCDKWRAIRDRRLLAVACDDPTVFHFVLVVEITGAGARTR